MAIIWESRREPSEEPTEIISPIASQDDLADWTESSMDDLGDLLYGDEDDEDNEAMDVEVGEELEAARPFVRQSGKGFGN